ncbi:MAG: PEP-CTERM sorting domain-containing protein [Armatimonadota bacterium]
MDYSSWLAQLDSIGGTANYNGLPTNVLGSNPYSETGSGVTVEAKGALWGQSDLNSISLLNNTDKMTFTFAGNAFGGYFASTDTNENKVADSLDFLVDGLYGQNLVTSSTGFSLLGYISNTDAPNSVDVSGDSTPEYVTVDSFTFGNKINASNPGSAVPEPGEYVSMAILGVGLCGMLIRSRRTKKSWTTITVMFRKLITSLCLVSQAQGGLLFTYIHGRTSRKLH